MKVFISWSGERSKRVAELFREFLPCLLQETEPWISTHDIKSGSFWFNEISEELASTNVGIVCLTAENKDKPWILFETGALVKGLSNARVSPYLIDIDPTAVASPLSQLNLVPHGKQFLLKLIKDINSRLDKRVNETSLEKIFDALWPEFEIKFNNILEETKTKNIRKEVDDEELLKEILLTVRRIENKEEELRLKTNENYYKAPGSIDDFILKNNNSINDLLRYAELSKRKLEDEEFEERAKKIAENAKNIRN